MERGHRERMSEHQAFSSWPGAASHSGAPVSPPSSPSPSDSGPESGAGSGQGSGPGSGRAHAGVRRGSVRLPVAALAALALGAAALGGGAAVGVEHLLGGGGSSSVAGAVADGSKASARAGGTVSAVAESVGPSVVEIKADTGGGQSTGSGVVISEDGEILTNNHVVAGADSVRITFSDGRTATADVVGRAADRDMALVKARDVDGLTPAKLGDSDDVGVGDQVVAIGSPEGLSGTVTSGIVSAKDRDVTVRNEGGGGRDGQSQGEGGDWPFEFGGGQYNGDPGEDTTTYKAIQTDASLNPGNSGGALVTMDGEVIGINSATYSSGSGSGSGSGGAVGSGGSVGLGFAVPVNSVKDVLGDLRSGAGVN